MKYTNEELTDAHDCHRNQKIQLRQSKKIGCFYCCKFVKFSDIKEWIDYKGCAICPLCGIDSLIGDASGFKITKVFLEAMYNKWFTPKRSSWMK